MMIFFSLSNQGAFHIHYVSRYIRNCTLSDRKDIYIHIYIYICVYTSTYVRMWYYINSFLLELLEQKEKSINSGFLYKKITQLHKVVVFVPSPHVQFYIQNI